MYAKGGKMKKIIALLIVAIMMLALVSCGGEGDPTPPADTSGSTGTGTTPGETLPPDDGPDEPGEQVPAVPVDNPTAKETIEESLTVFENSSYAEKSNVSDFEGYDELVDMSKVDGKKIIENGGVYRVTGSLEDGQIYIKAPNKSVTLVLDNVNLINKTKAAPAIYAEDCASVTIILPEGTENYIEDNAKNGENGAIRVRSCGLTIDGQGTLTIKANRKNGISCTKEIEINGGIFNITTPSNDGHGIYGKLGLTIDSGKFNITAGKSGFKSGDADENAVGYVNINYTHTTINCGTNAINCNGPVDINGGYINATSKTGNGIDATKDINISKTTLIFNTSKSAIATDSGVNISEKTNIKISTNGNGISANDIIVSTTGVIYIETIALYEKYTPTDGETEIPDRYIRIDGEYVDYDESTHGTDVILYTRRNCKGFKADSMLIIASGKIGIDSYEDAINASTVKIEGGEVYVSTFGDGIESTETTVDGANTEFVVLGSEKGIKGKTSVSVNNGQVTVNARVDAINSAATKISGGVVYLFDKIDKGETGTAEVTGGEVIMLSTTSNSQRTTGEQSYITSKVSNFESCVYGKWIKLTIGEKEIVIKLPKNYSEKMAAYYSNSDLPSELTLEIGTCEGATPVNTYVYSGGLFETEITETID